MRAILWTHRASRTLGICRSTDCIEPTDDSKLYCSDQCAMRERSRRRRYREYLRREHDRCNTCGTKHHDVGEVSL